MDSPAAANSGWPRGRLLTAWLADATSSTFFCVCPAFIMVVSLRS